MSDTIKLKIRDTGIRSYSLIGSGGRWNTTLGHFSVSLMTRRDLFSSESVFSLHGGAYLIGPRQLRQSADKASMKRCRDLEQAKLRHRSLDRQISELDEPKHLGSPSVHAMVKALKRDKLHLKDRIAGLERRLMQERLALHDSTKLGSGGFGKVWLAKCTSSSKEVAVKVALMEDFDALKAEHNALKRLSKQPGFPRALYFGQQDVPDSLSDIVGHVSEQGGSLSTEVVMSSLITSSPPPFPLSPRTVLVMDALGPSLERLMNETTLGTGGLSPGTVLSLAVQMLERLESLSTCGLVHGDIQLGNFLMGKDGPIHQRTVYLIDFGLSSSSIPSKSISSRNSRDPHHESSPQPSSSGGPPGSVGRAASNRVSGTLDFSSSRVLQGLQPQPRDDLESLAYCLAYMLHGSLPWSNIPLNPMQDLMPLSSERDSDGLAMTAEAIAEAKDTCSITGCLFTNDGVSQGSSSSNHVAERFIHRMLSEAKSLPEGGATAPPDYCGLRRDATEALAEIGVPEGADVIFDWEVEGISWSPVDGSLTLEGYR